MNIYQTVRHSVAHAAITNHLYVEHWKATLAYQKPESEFGQDAPDATLCGRGLLYQLLLSYGTQLDLRSSLCVCETGRLMLPGTDWYVSISHAAHWTAVALSKIPVGIDIEDKNCTHDWQAVTEMLLPDSMKQAIWDSEDASRQEIFLRNWVRVEASAKINKGLVLPVTEADITGEASQFETETLIGCIVTGRYPISAAVKNQCDVNKDYPGAAHVC